MSSLRCTYSGGGNYHYFKGGEALNVHSLYVHAWEDRGFTVAYCLQMKGIKNSHEDGGGLKEELRSLLAVGAHVAGGAGHLTTAPTTTRITCIDENCIS